MGATKGQYFERTFWHPRIPPKNERKNSFIVLLGQKNELFRSLFGGIVGLKKPFRICLTFRYCKYKHVKVVGTADVLQTRDMYISFNSVILSEAPSIYSY